MKVTFFKENKTKEDFSPVTRFYIRMENALMVLMLRLDIGLISLSNILCVLTRKMTPLVFLGNYLTF